MWEKQAWGSGPVWNSSALSLPCCRARILDEELLGCLAIRNDKSHCGRHYQHPPISCSPPETRHFSALLQLSKVIVTSVSTGRKDLIAGELFLSLPLSLPVTKEELFSSGIVTPLSVWVSDYIEQTLLLKYVGCVIWTRNKPCVTEISGLFVIIA